MKKALILLFALLTFVGAKANDGVFYASGNQLIPITESDISVKKEVLTINRVGDHLEVTVYYEFFNPTKPKDLLVGFEAPAPYPGDENYMKLFPEQPHMRNFKVVVNGEQLSYEITHVKGNYYSIREEGTAPNYYSNGKIQDMTRKECVAALEEVEYFDYAFYFVYHFNAHFREGLNVVQHTYDFDLSYSVEEEFNFDYILTAANRWANKGIDDFTLVINMGDRESFMVQPYFFKDAKEWTINGKGKVTMETEWGFAAEDGSPVFHIQEGSIIYKKKNFHPEGELVIAKRHDMITYHIEAFSDDWDGKDAIEALKNLYHQLNADYYQNCLSKFSPEHRRILRNLPFAYRGYVFKNQDLKKYFESTKWYLPNPDYVDRLEELTEKEKEWVEFWK